jgi:hypothetical protein
MRLSVGCHAGQERDDGETEDENELAWSHGYAPFTDQPIGIKQRREILPPALPEAHTISIGAIARRVKIFLN